MKRITPFWMQSFTMCTHGNTTWTKKGSKGTQKGVRNVRWRSQENFHFKAEAITIHILWGNGHSFRRCWKFSWKSSPFRRTQVDEQVLSSWASRQRVRTIFRPRWCIHMRRMKRSISILWIEDWSGNKMFCLAFKWESTDRQCRHARMDMWKQPDCYQPL